MTERQAATGGEQRPGRDEGRAASGELVGLVPAAGAARRLGALPLSKELLPVGVDETPDGPAVRVACQSLLDAFAAGGVARAYVVLREGKEHVARFLGPGLAAPGLASAAAPAVPLAYLLLRHSPSLPATLDAAYSFVRGARVALGFPDVQLRAGDAFARLAARQAATGADLVLGLVEPRRPETTDMVELGGEDRVVRLEVRPASTTLRWCWVLAVWGPRFTEHLHAQVAAAAPAAAAGGPELQIGAVVAAALAAGLDVRGLPVPGRTYLDVGTPADLRAAWRG